MPETIHTEKVGIVGGGLGGLLSSISLLRQGYNVVIYVENM